MSPATSSSTSFSSAERSTRPRASDGTCTASYPAMVTDAGFVPCAESGITIFLRAAPFFEWNARMMSRPVSSPDAPAGGWNVHRDIPVSSQRASSSRHNSSSAPWMVPSGWCGCSRWNPGIAATVSATFGLYFIEHDPRG